MCLVCMNWINEPAPSSKPLLQAVLETEEIRYATAPDTWRLEETQAVTISLSGSISNIDRSSSASVKMQTVRTNSHVHHVIK